MKNLTLKNRISIKICRSNRQVFLRSDFKKLGDYDQVGRALRNLETEGQIMRLGYGIYAKARFNRFTGKPMLSAEGGFEQVAREALQRLKVNYKPSEAVNLYQNGSSQIPVNTQFEVLDRFTRKIGTDTFQLELIKNARN